MYDLQRMFEVLDLIKNPDKYQQYLETLDAKQKEFLQIVEAAGSVSEIESLKDQAKQELQKAKEKAEKTLKAAEEKSEKLMKQAQQNLQEAENLRISVAMLEDKHKRELKAVDELKQELEKQQQIMQKEREDIQIRLEEIRKKEEDLNNKLFRLRELV